MQTVEARLPEKISEKNFAKTNLQTNNPYAIPIKDGLVQDVRLDNMTLRRKADKGLGNTDSGSRFIKDQSDSSKAGSAYDESRVFALDSSYQKFQMQDYQEETSKQIDVLNATFDKSLGQNVMNIRDSSGNLIVNADTKNIWFKDYVAFIFSMGCIFNENDQEKLHNILNLFHNDGELSFLMNYFKVASYDDELVEAIEKRMEIGNGNYHCCLITIVTTQDKSVLAGAPEKQYSVPGVIQKYCDWDEIYTFMKRTIARYGLATERKISHTDALSNEIGYEGKSTRTKRGRDYSGESNFDIDINPYDDEQISLKADLSFKREREETFQARTRNTKMMRENKDGSYNPHRDRNLKNGSLYQRIARDAESGIIDTTIPNKELGAELKLNVYKMPSDQIPREYQLYNDDSTYEIVQGINLPSENAATRAEMPKFTPTDIRGSKARVVVKNPVQFVKNGKV